MQIFFLWHYKPLSKLITLNTFFGFFGLGSFPKIVHFYFPLYRPTLLLSAIAHMKYFIWKCLLYPLPSLLDYPKHKICFEGIFSKSLCIKAIFCI